VLEGTLVRLEPFDSAEVTDEYVSWLNDPETFRFLGTKFGQTRATAREYVEGVQAPDILCRIVERAQRRHVGNIALHQIHPIHRSAELGIMIGAADARGKGFGREACRLIIEYGFDHLNLHKITAGTVDKNVAMKQVFLGLGFAIEGTLVQQFYLEGAYHDIFRFGLHRGSFRPRD
jgi:ribosomal-protein-alanine N-acetyltransferase